MARRNNSNNARAEATNSLCALLVVEGLEPFHVRPVVTLIDSFHCGVVLLDKRIDGPLHQLGASQMLGLLRQGGLFRSHSWSVAHGKRLALIGRDAGSITVGRAM